MFQIQSLLHNCNRDVGRNRDPYLRFHGIFRVAIKGFDSKVLFDPLEEQFDLPALFVNCANSVGWQEGEIVCQKLEGIACFAVEERFSHVQCVKSREVDIRFIYHVKRSSLDIALLAKDIKYFYIMYFFHR